LLRNVERYQKWHSVAAVTRRRTDDNCNGQNKSDNSQTMVE
jgi:hypothetical protein